MAANGSTVTAPLRDAVRYAAARVPVAIVSGAFRAEIEPVVEAAEIARDTIDRRPGSVARRDRRLERRCAPRHRLEPRASGRSPSRNFYGSRADRVVGLSCDRPELLERVHCDAPDIAAQVISAAQQEWATSAEDVVHRRTTLAARGLSSPDVVSRVAGLLDSA